MASATSKAKMASVLCRFALLLSLVAVSGCIDPDLLVDDVSYYVDRARCNLRVGVLAETRLAPLSDGVFLKALRYFAAREVDAVVIAGDVTQDGSLAQRRSAKTLWRKVFKEGSPVALIVVTGENDNEKVYEELAGRPYSTVFTQEVKGYAFVGANWRDATGADAWALKPILSKMTGPKPFFYVQSLIPYGTCCPYEDRPLIFDGGKVAYMLSKHTNAVAICGRSCTPLTDESAFWCGNLACVNAGSLSCSKLRGTDGGSVSDAHHGLVMSVYDSAIVFERLDFGREADSRSQQGVHVEKLGADWRVGLPIRPQKRPSERVPQFWDDTRLMVFPSERTVSVRFPPVLAKHTGVRAYAYEVCCKGAESDDEVVRRLVYSPACCASEARETRPVACDFARQELPKGKVRFEVVPVDAFGGRGRPVAGEVAL